MLSVTSGLEADNAHQEKGAPTAGDMWQQLLGRWLVILAYGVSGSWVSAPSYHTWRNQEDARHAGGMSKMR